MDFTPKLHFSIGPNAQPWTDVVSSKLFTEAAEAAMLQMQANQGYAHSPFETERNTFQLEGARIFLSILMNLTTPPSEARQRPRSENLNHSV